MRLPMQQTVRSRPVRRLVYDPFRSALVLGCPCATITLDTEISGQELRASQTEPTPPVAFLKRAGRYWSARVGRDFRAVARERSEGLLWFWIGSHDEYERLIG